MPDFALDLAAADTLEIDVMRELHYVAGVGLATHFLRGQVARAQDAALQRGWLDRDVLRPDQLVLTPRGRRILAAAAVEQR